MSEPALLWDGSREAYRACRLCDHGRDGTCARPEVRAAFEAARRTGGACGPDARYLTIKGFDYSKETV